MAPTEPSGPSPPPGPPPDPPGGLSRRRRLPPAVIVAAILAAPFIVVVALMAVGGDDGRATRSTAPTTTSTTPAEETTTTVEETTTAPEPPPEPETTTTLAPPDPNVKSLQALVVGECFDTPPEGVTEVRLIDCDQPHTDEVFEVIVLNAPQGARYPRDLDEQAEERCYDAFVTYVGAPPEDTPYDYDWYTPTEAEWRRGARRIPCVVTDPDGKPITGSAAG